MIPSHFNKITPIKQPVLSYRQHKRYRSKINYKEQPYEDIPATGLGMYVTKQFIKTMGGKLWFDSVAGQGTTFYFTLPVAAQNNTVPTHITPL